MLDKNNLKTAAGKLSADFPLKNGAQKNYDFHLKTVTSQNLTIENGIIIKCDKKATGILRKSRNRKNIYCQQKSGYDFEKR